MEGGIAENNLLVGVGGSDNVGHGLTGAGIHHGSYIAGLDQGAGSRGSYVGADLNQGKTLTPYKDFVTILFNFRPN